MFDRLAGFFRGLVRRLDQPITRRLEAIMAKLQDVKDEIETLKGFVASEAAEVQATVAALTEQITALRKRLDEGGLGVTPADLDTILASLKDAEVSISNIVTPEKPAEGAE